MTSSSPHLPPLDPKPAYQSTAHLASPSFYHAIAATGTTPHARALTTSFTIPIRSGRAWPVPAGHICRITTPHGPQVGDLNIWNLHNPRERFWAARTRQLHRSHVTTLDRLWSCLPYLRPLVTITADSLQGYGVDGVGGRATIDVGWITVVEKMARGRLMHDRTSAVNTLLTGDAFDFHCHSNLTRAILPYGLAESDVHDVLNLFQVTGLNRNGEYFMRPSPACTNDYFEFFAETDILCALSTCPGGDLSAWGWGEGNAGDMVGCCRPLGVEVYRMTDEKRVLEGWREPEVPAYKGLHGLKLPTFQQ
ncbi:MAG: hypothetical protein M1830_006725 [Pleopsidium flavum]|nr:MAG: hypothetical protein M1830_006725 [Pleopsidium flavum]